MLKALLTFGLTRRPIVFWDFWLFIGAGLFAFSKLNIEAYPNPAPVILEITAQAPGLSAEEMERYYTIPMEVGLAATPGVDVIRSTSFYGLSFVRVTFKYGVDYYFALTQAALQPAAECQPAERVRPQIQAIEPGRRDLPLPGGRSAAFRADESPHHPGLDRQRRLLHRPGRRCRSTTWGGTTKEYDVDVDLHKLDAYNVTLPQIITALGNANINVGGRTINVGQQSVNIRGIGLLDSGGDADLTQGYHVEDIENVVWANRTACPSW